MTRVARGPVVARWIASVVGALARRYEDTPRLAFVGIHRLGVPLAHRLAAGLSRRTGHAYPLGSLDITLYRDDLDTTGTKPVVHGTSLPFDVSGMHVILVDDILFTGRTIRAALDEIVDFGRPASIALAVLIDRGHRELPIQPDFVGHVMKTNRTETVRLRLRETDGEDAVDCVRRGDRE
ncbi:MAG: bifunctional pyr operon transcriptional regulator/uracil phosphoribosyltransferase PyrR [Planctomycetes bacterium]|nr:bifunctional pyr operon transcriptional regulator/uracil phosphoribosyltransferase PyrR [Planctomycetota bacterium]